MDNRAKVTSIDACNRFALTEPAIVGTASGSTEYGRVDGVCPVHGSTSCVETYVAESELAKLTLLEFLTARRVWRARSARRAHRRGDFRA